MEVFAINSPVRVGPVNQRTIEGVITGIFIREERVTYEVSYWNERDYRTVTLNEFEIDGRNATKMTIGFRP